MINQRDIEEWWKTFLTLFMPYHSMSENSQSRNSGSIWKLWMEQIRKDCWQYAKPHIVQVCHRGLLSSTHRGVNSFPWQEVEVIWPCIFSGILPCLNASRLVAYQNFPNKSTGIEVVWFVTKADGIQVDHTCTNSRRFDN